MFAIMLLLSIYCREPILLCYYCYYAIIKLVMYILQRVHAIMLLLSVYLTELMLLCYNAESACCYAIFAIVLFSY